MRAWPSVRSSHCCAHHLSHVAKSVTAPFTRELITAFGCKGSVALFEIVKDTTVIVRAIWDQ
ncbi:hypothetical protein B9Z52_13750 [Limnohabitans sp. Jir72]|nr:hypothetical protein B9Z52_13750 [Limnohabitans sp. Jir72]